MPFSARSGSRPLNATEASTAAPPVSDRVLGPVKREQGAECQLDHARSDPLWIDLRARAEGWHHQTPDVQQPGNVSKEE